MQNATDFAKLLSRYFNTYLVNQRGVSPGTILTYRQAFVQFVEFMNDSKNTKPEKILLKDFSRENILFFIGWLEKEKKCSISTRNLRLAVMRSFASFIKFDHPDHLEECMLILSIRFKKAISGEMVYLKNEGMKLLLEQPDQSTTAGRRDFLILSLFYTTGIRVSELISIRIRDISLETPKVLKVLGKGRKIRFVPLLKQVVLPLKRYLEEHKLTEPQNFDDFLFLNHLKTQFTRQGVFHVVTKYVKMARVKNPSLIPEGIGCHSIRHSTAMELVNSGVDLIYIRDLLA
jgi:integrase/recombinase XerD